MSESGRVTSAELAERMRAPEAHIRVWLDAQAAEDFLDYDASTADATALRDLSPRTG